MKKLVLLLTVSTLSTSALAQETSWLDSLKDLVGLGETATEQKVEKTEEAKQAVVDAAPSASGLVDMLTQSLNVNSEQASGGMGAIFNYVKNNVSAEQFAQLGQSIPGLSGLLGSVPSVEKSGEAEQGLGGLLDKAAEYNTSLKAVNDVKKQFEALGLKPEMISSFITSAQTYLNTEEGKQAKEVLTAGLGKLLG